MTKPSITTRAVKGSALTWTEGDTNLENLRDATITIKADTGGTDVVSDLNGTVTLVAGTNVTLTGDNTAKTITIDSTASGGATDLNGLTDVDYSGAGIAAGDILKWYVGAGSSYFTNAQNNLSGISDVKDMMSPSDGDVLTWSSSNSQWENIAPSGGALDDLSDVTITTPTAGQVLTYTMSGGWENQNASAGGIASLSADTNPALGGNLDVADYSITNTITDGNVVIAPNGAGNTIIESNLVLDQSGSTTMLIKTGTGQGLVIVTNGDVETGSISIDPGTTGDAYVNSQRDIYLSTNIDASNASGNIFLNSLKFPSSDGTADQVLTTDGSGNLGWATASGGGALDDLSDVTITTPTSGQVLTYTMSGGWENQNAPAGGIASVSADMNPALGGNLDVADYSIVNTITNGNITITPDGTGKIILDGLSWPNADGSNGQVLTTNGSGTLSWATPTETYTGTVTSVSGTGTVNGLSLSGTVTSSGSLTLGGTLDLSSPPAIGGTTAAAGSFTTLTIRAANDLRLADSDSSNYVGFKAPATVSANKIWTLPSADGTSGQVLSTNGSGTLSWATAGGGGGTSVAVLSMDGNGVRIGTAIPYLFRTTFTEVTDINNIVTLADSNNRFVLGAGTYLILSEFVRYAIAEARPTSNHRLYSITGSADLVSSIANFYTITTNTYAYYPVRTYFTLAASTTIEYRFENSVNAYTNQHLNSFYIYKLA